MSEMEQMQARLALLESRLTAVEMRGNEGTLDTRHAMERLGYKSGKRFWQAVRRLCIPYSRLSKRQCVFFAADIDYALQRRQVGTRRRFAA